MSRTPLGAVLLGSALAGFGLAVLTGSLMPAVAALLLLGALEGARRHGAAAPVTAGRTVPAKAALDAPFTVHVEAQGPPGLPLSLEEDPPPGLQVLGRTKRPGRGRASLEMRLQADAAGAVEWRGTTAVVGDPWGLWQVPQQVPAPGRTEVTPEAQWQTRGRAMGRRHTVRTQSASKRIGEKQPEVATIREHQPGDALRDVDWARSSRMEGLFTRQREQSGPRPILVLLDATRPMRVAQGTPKLTTAARIAAGVASAAEGAGARASLVAFHEEGLERTSGAGFRQVLHRLARLPPAAQGPLLATTTGHPADVHDQRFLRRLAVFVGGTATATPPFEAALGLLMRVPDKAFVVALLDGEADPRRAEVAVDRLRRRGHQVVLVVPATGAHHATRSDLQGPLAQELRGAHLRRARLQAEMVRRGVPMLVALPGREAQIIEEVARSAR